MLSAAVLTEPPVPTGLVGRLPEQTRDLYLY